MAWQTMTPVEKEEYLDWVASQMDSRWEMGDLKYNSSVLGFQGDPLQHAIEEALDLLCYLWYIQRKEKEKAINGSNEGRSGT